MPDSHEEKAQAALDKLAIRVQDFPMQVAIAQVHATLALNDTLKIIAEDAKVIAAVKRNLRV